MMMTTRVESLSSKEEKQPTGAAQSAHRTQQQAYRVFRPCISKSSGPGFDSRLVSRVPYLRHRKIVLRPPKVMLDFELQNIAASILGHFQIPR